MAKHNNSPRLTGSPEWYGWMQDLEARFQSYGVVDIVHNGWEFERWETSDDPTAWSLTIDGEDVWVPFYGAYSGGTGPEDITAELVYYDHDDPPDSIEGKIVITPTRPPPAKPFPRGYRNNYTYVDYEYRTDGDTYPELFEFVDPRDSYTFDIYYQLGQQLQQIAIDGNAAGLLIVYDMGFERVSGLYAFPVPSLYNVPTLALDRAGGAKVLANLAQGKTAILRLESRTENADAYQLIAYLPGPQLLRTMVRWAFSQRSNIFRIFRKASGHEHSRSISTAALHRRHGSGILGRYLVLATSRDEEPRSCPDAHGASWRNRVSSGW
jgi:hypothetical protein